MVVVVGYYYSCTWTMVQVYTYCLWKPYKYFSDACYESLRLNYQSPNDACDESIGLKFLK